MQNPNRDAERFSAVQTIAPPSEAKWAFTTRRVPRNAPVGLNKDVAAARPGDLVLGRVDAIGAHKRLQLASGRPSGLYVGDLVVAACGARYAPDQFEGVAAISPKGADLLAGGGVLGAMRSRNGRMASPTVVAPLGLLTGADGAAINVAGYALPFQPRPDLPAIAVVGASMNAGKTTAAASLAHGLTRAGFRVAALKATGTGAFGDYNAYLDAGAAYVADFVDAGMASTYMEPPERIAQATDALLAGAAEAGCDLAIVELADGVYQRETAALLAEPGFRDVFSGFLYAVGDALAAKGGTDVLSRLGVRPAGLTGLIGRSPLAISEAEAATGLEVLTRETLLDPASATAILNRMTASPEASADRLAA